jgi:hypothetical protein
MNDIRYVESKLASRKTLSLMRWEFERCREKNLKKSEYALYQLCFRVK